MDHRPRKQQDMAAAPSRSAAYDEDLYTWSMEQAALLRAGRIAEADVLNIAEEIDDVGKQEYYRLESALRVLLTHMLKWDYQPKRRSRSWWSSITVQRNQIRDLLDDNPGLKPRLESAVSRAYRNGRVEASAQTRLGLKTSPVDCPYSWQDIMERPVDWPDE